MAAITFFLFLNFLALALSIPAPRPFHAELDNLKGGFLAEKGQFPYYVSVQVKLFMTSISSDHYCGGSIIDKKWILITAHCSAGLEMLGSKFTVVVGVTELGNAESNFTRYEFSDIYRHPEFELGDPNFDIALIKLKDPITFSANVKSIGLPKVDMNKFDALVNVSGFDPRDEENGSSRVLRYMPTKIFDQELCEQFVSNGYVDESVICISRIYEEGPSKVMIDFDGPVVAGDVQVGIVSPVSFWDDFDEDIPVVTTNIFSCLDWIQSHISE